MSSNASSSNDNQDIDYTMMNSVHQTNNKTTASPASSPSSSLKTRRFCSFQLLLSTIFTSLFLFAWGLPYTVTIVFGAVPTIGSATNSITISIGESLGVSLERQFRASTSYVKSISNLTRNYGSPFLNEQNHRLFVSKSIGNFLESPNWIQRQSFTKFSDGSEIYVLPSGAETAQYHLCQTDGFYNHSLSYSDQPFPQNFTNCTFLHINVENRSFITPVKPLSIVPGGYANPPSWPRMAANRIAGTAPDFFYGRVFNKQLHGSSILLLALTHVQLHSPRRYANDTAKLNSLEMLMSDSLSMRSLNNMLRDLLPTKESYGQAALSSTSATSKAFLVENSSGVPVAATIDEPLFYEKPSDWVIPEELSQLCQREALSGAIACIYDIETYPPFTLLHRAIEFSNTSEYKNRDSSKSSEEVTFIEDENGGRYLWSSQVVHYSKDVVFVLHVFEPDDFILGRVHSVLFLAFAVTVSLVAVGFVITYLLLRPIVSVVEELSEKMAKNPFDRSLITTYEKQVVLKTSLLPPSTATPAPSSSSAAAGTIRTSLARFFTFETEELSLLFSSYLELRMMIEELRSFMPQRNEDRVRGRTEITMTGAMMMAKVKKQQKTASGNADHDVTNHDVNDNNNNNNKNNNNNNGTNSNSSGGPFKKQVQFATTAQEFTDDDDDDTLGVTDNKDQVVSQSRENSSRQFIAGNDKDDASVDTVTTDCDDDDTASHSNISRSHSYRRSTSTSQSCTTTPTTKTTTTNAIKSSKTVPVKITPSRSREEFKQQQRQQYLSKQRSCPVARDQEQEQEQNQSLIPKEITDRHKKVLPNSRFLVAIIRAGEGLKSVSDTMMMRSHHSSLSPAVMMMSAEGAGHGDTSISHQQQQNLFDDLNFFIDLIYSKVILPTGAHLLEYRNDFFLVALRLSKRKSVSTLARRFVSFLIAASSELQQRQKDRCQQQQQIRNNHRKNTDCGDADNNINDNMKKNNTPQRHQVFLTAAISTGNVRVLKASEEDWSSTVSTKSNLMTKRGGGVSADDAAAADEDYSGGSITNTKINTSATHSTLINIPLRTFTVVGDCFKEAQYADRMIRRCRDLLHIFSSPRSPSAASKMMVMATSEARNQSEGSSPPSSAGDIIRFDRDDDDDEEQRGRENNADNDDYDLLVEEKHMKTVTTFLSKERNRDDERMPHEIVYCRTASEDCLGLDECSSTSKLPSVIQKSIVANAVGLNPSARYFRVKKINDY